jgi:hypothetical protein
MSWFYSPLLPAAQQQAATQVTKAVTVSAVLTWAGQEAHPLSDVSDGSWITDAGATTIAAAIDEVVENDADYIHSNSTSTTAEVLLDPITIPQAGSVVTILVRARKV